jgi:hypothetical protein
MVIKIKKFIKDDLIPFLIILSLILLFILLGFSIPICACMDSDFNPDNLKQPNPKLQQTNWNSTGHFDEKKTSVYWDTEDSVMLYNLTQNNQYSIIFGTNLQTSTDPYNWTAREIRAEIQFQLKLALYNDTGHRPYYLEVSLFEYNGTNWLRFDTTYWNIFIPNEEALKNIFGWVSLAPDLLSLFIIGIVIVSVSLAFLIQKVKF